MRDESSPGFFPGDAAGNVGMGTLDFLEHLDTRTALFSSLMYLRGNSVTSSGQPPKSVVCVIVFKSEHVGV